MHEPGSALPTDDPHALELERMRERIRAVGSAARTRLEPDSREREELTREVNAYADRFLESLAGGLSYVPGPPGGNPFDASIEETPADIASVLERIARDIDRPGINPASGGHLGYIPGGGLYASALGDYLAAVSNRYAGVAYASPGAVALEKRLLDWMARLVGYPATAAGDLSSGGSIANLVGIVAAREAAGIRAADIPRSAVYRSDQAHHCVDKAIRIAGLGECPVRSVPVDAGFRMDVAALARLMEADRAAGLRPWLVVASAGTTDTGTVDPLGAIAETAHEHGAWLHLDAAYGGFFVLTPQGAQRLAGMEHSDSIVMDPHKGLFLPYGTGAVLVKDVQALHRAHHYQANYMQDATADMGDLSPADLSPELSRHFRGLRLWLPLKLSGVAAFRAALEEKLLLARYFHARIGRVPGFEVGPEPDLSVVTYRYRPPRGDPDHFNRELAAAIRADGRIFISTTRLNDVFMLRAAILSVRTHLEQVELALDLLEHHARRLSER